LLGYLYGWLLAQFAIQFNARNNTGLQRDEVIKKVAGLVGQPHKVKLDEPELTIIIEAYQVRAACAANN